MYLLESSLTGGDFFECVRNSISPTGGWILVFVVYTIMSLLMLNMLIAQMAKTFDSVKEASEMNYLFLFAQTVCSVAEQPPVPPPLYALTIPYDCSRRCKKEDKDAVFEEENWRGRSKTGKPKADDAKGIEE